jgi:predicted amidophosphoribosyltransferase
MKDDLLRPFSRPSTCPVCRARFRSSSLCSRCGADLTALMLLAAHAYALRESARRSLRQGDCRTALASADAAQRLHSTAEGSLLSMVCASAANPPSGQLQKQV